MFLHCFTLFYWLLLEGIINRSWLESASVNHRQPWQRKIDLSEIKWVQSETSGSYFFSRLLSSEVFTDYPYPMYCRHYFTPCGPVDQYISCIYVPFHYGYHNCMCTTVHMGQYTSSTTSPQSWGPAVLRQICLPTIVWSKLFTCLRLIKRCVNTIKLLFPRLAKFPYISTSIMRGRKSPHPP